MLQVCFPFFMLPASLIGNTCCRFNSNIWIFVIAWHGDHFVFFKDFFLDDDWSITVTHTVSTSHITKDFCKCLLGWDVKWLWPSIRITYNEGRCTFTTRLVSRNWLRFCILQYCIKGLRYRRSGILETPSEFLRRRLFLLRDDGPGSGRSSVLVFFCGSNDSLIFTKKTSLWSRVMPSRPSTLSSESNGRELLHMREMDSFNMRARLWYSSCSLITVVRITRCTYKHGTEWSDRPATGVSA